MLRNILTRRILAGASRAASLHATPFYLFDPLELLRQARAWRRAAESVAPAGIFYPYKCNRLAPVPEHLAREGLGAEVTSCADLREAARRGLGGARVVIQGPAKETDLIDAGLAAGALFVADGREDASAILDRAHALAAVPRYLLRLAPSAASADQRAFGLSARELLSLARDSSRRGAPGPEGLAFHLGTGIPSEGPYLRAIREVGRVARALAPLRLSTGRLDLGGGFAASSESRLDERGRPRTAERNWAQALPRLAASARRLLGPQVQLLFEPGRALVSSSFHLVARVTRIRRRRNGATAYLDASRLSHAFFVARGRHSIAAIPHRRGSRRRVALAGPLGVGLDLFTADTRLPPLTPGDLVVIGSVGAYNLNAGNTWAGKAPPIVEIE